MGHAHHFLSRLDRLSIPHLELALALYRDDERLRYVLEQARVPEGAERVAVSLDDPHLGPFVLVTRTGRFITCLKHGMRTSDLPIITRAELDAISAKHVLWQGREAAIGSLGDGDGGASFLLGRLLDAGPFLAREEFQALAALHPLIGDEYFETCVEWTLTARRIQLDLKGVLKKRGPRLRSDQLEKLHMHWKTFFAAGHLAVLSLVDGGEMLHARGGGAVLTGNIERLTALVSDGCILSKMVRGSWALGQLGRPGLEALKQQVAKATTGINVISAAIGLIAIGARHEALRAEVLDALAPVPQLATEEARIWVRYFADGTANLFADIEDVLASHQRSGAALAHAFRDYYPSISPYRYARPEDVPADIAFSEPFQIIANFGSEPGMMPKALSMIVPAARAEPEQLYLPRRCVEFLEQKWMPEHSLQLLEGWLEIECKPAPRPTGPARKGACPCGSGKKYKRCCEVAVG